MDIITILFPFLIVFGMFFSVGTMKVDIMMILFSVLILFHERLAVEPMCVCVCVLFLALSSLLEKAFCPLS